MEEIVKYIMHEYVGDRYNKIRLEKGETYYLALSASDSNGNESEKTHPPISVQIEEILVTTTTTTYSRSPSSSPTTTIKPDESSPTGTIIINKGNEITPSQFVTLFLSAADDESGMGQGAQMSLSNDNK